MLHRKARMAINAILKGATSSLETGLDQYARACFLEGFMQLPVGSLSKRPLLLFARILTALESDDAAIPGPTGLYLEALREQFDDDAIRDFFEPKDSRLYSALDNALRRDNRTQSPTDIVPSVVVGLNPVTGEPIPAFKGKPLFWHIGFVFRRDKKEGSDGLIKRVRTYAVRAVVNAKLSVVRDEKSKKIKEESLTVGDNGDGSLLERGLPDTTYQDEDALDFSTVLLDPKIANALNRGVLKRIQSRASNAHGNADVKARQDIETAIWIAVQNKAALMDVQSTQGAFDFSIKQTALADEVNSLTGKQSSPQYLGRVFKETIAFDLKMLLTSGPIRDMIDSKTDIARTYYGDVHRRRAALRASIKRVAGLYIRKMAEGCPDNLDESECKEWEANTEKYKDVVKDRAKTAGRVFKFSVPVGPSGVNEVAVRLSKVGIKAEAGTERIYGFIKADDEFDAADALNKAAGYKIVADRDISRVIR